MKLLAKRKFDSLRAKGSATPPPPTTPSSTAALVACIASSTRSLRSLTSTSLFAADADDGDLARQLGETLLKLLAVVIGGRLLQALVKRDGFTRRYIQRLGLPRLSKPGPGRGNPARPPARRAHRVAFDRTRSTARMDRAAQTARKLSRKRGRAKAKFLGNGTVTEATWTVSVPFRQQKAPCEAKAF